MTQWIEAGDDGSSAAQWSDCREGMYVRAVGSIKTLDGKRALTGFTIKPLADSNEITHHVLSTTLAYLRASKGPLPAPGAQLGAKPLAGAYVKQEAAVTDTGFSSDQQAVMAIIRGSHDDSGVNVHSIVAQLKQRYSEQQIRCVPPPPPRMM